jgi:hypothetical protein
MNIEILCDQFDCIHNDGHTVHHDHPNDTCKHSHPAIQRYPIRDKLSNNTQFILNGQTICNSKERDMTDPNKEIPKSIVEILEEESNDEIDYLIPESILTDNVLQEFVKENNIHHCFVEPLPNHQIKTKKSY